jgi:hypothetical protein
MQPHQHPCLIPVIVQVLCNAVNITPCEAISSATADIVVAVQPEFQVSFTDQDCANRQLVVWCGVVWCKEP